MDHDEYFLKNRKNSPFNEDLFIKNQIALEPYGKKIWAIGGGKGGVGKSMVASSFSIRLAQLGYQVIAIDLDLGGANLHTTLGVEPAKDTVEDFFQGRAQSLSQCLFPTGIKNLSLINAAQNPVQLDSLDSSQKMRFIQGLRELKADYLVFDLGAGMNHYTLDFFNMADVGVLVILPEPTSIENVYRFIKGVYYKRLLNAPSLAPMKPLIEMSLDYKNPLSILSPADLYKHIQSVSPEMSFHLKKEIEKFKPHLIINQSRTQVDVDIGNSIKIVCKKYFGIDLCYLGHLDHDSLVWQSIRRKKPLFLEFPDSPIVTHLRRLVEILMDYTKEA